MTPTLRKRLLLPLLFLLAGACTTVPNSPQVGDMPTRRDPHVLTGQEIRESSANDTYEAVRMLRPVWLRKRGAMSVNNPSDVVVYVDNVNLGGPGALRSIPVSSVVRLQFLDASSATQRWGTNHVHGAILVSTM